MVTKHLLSKLRYEMTRGSHVDRDSAKKSTRNQAWTGSYETCLAVNLFVRDVLEMKEMTLANMNTKWNKAILMTKVSHLRRAHGCETRRLRLSSGEDEHVASTVACGCLDLEETLGKVHQLSELTSSWSRALTHVTSFDTLKC